MRRLQGFRHRRVLGDQSSFYTFEEWTLPSSDKFSGTRSLSNSLGRYNRLPVVRDGVNAGVILAGRRDFPSVFDRMEAITLMLMRIS
jgi:hypothetical protein